MLSGGGGQQGGLDGEIGWSAWQKARRGSEEGGRKEEEEEEMAETETFTRDAASERLKTASSCGQSPAESSHRNNAPALNGR